MLAKRFVARERKKARGKERARKRERDKEKARPREIGKGIKKLTGKFINRRACISVNMFLFLTFKE